MSLDALLSHQAGVVSRAQALAAGMSRDAVDRHVRTRRWQPLHPCVYLTSGDPEEDEVRARAAALWAGPSAVLCGLAAAWWWGMVATLPPDVTVTIDVRCRPRHRPGVVVRRRRLDTDDREVHRGVGVTTAALTVVEAALDLGDAGSALLDRLLPHDVAFADVAAVHRRRVGTTGSATTGRLLAAAAVRATAAAERALVDLLQNAAVPGWRIGAAVGGHRVGVAFPAARLAVEARGWAWAVDGVAAQREERQRAALAERGWSVLRVDRPDLVERQADVLAGITGALRWASVAGAR